MAPEAQTPAQCPDGGQLPGMGAYNLLRTKHFHGVSSGSQHPYFLKSRYGKVRNKGSQRHKRGRKRPKYQAPYPEHPDTAQPIATTDIHANHLEAFNTSLRRRCAAYRRRTNTYAKNQARLQERLDVYWIVHNFVRVHFTPHQVPAVALGVLQSGLSLNEVFFLQKIA